MKIGVLGTGTVGSTIASKLIQLDHQVMMGSREPNNPAGAQWAKTAGPNACHGTFAATARFGEIVFNCTAGMHSLEALHQAGAANLAGKILIDVANPLDFSKGMPPTLSVSNTDSLGERIQRAFPEARVVKTLNTVNAVLMVHPGLVPGDHNLFVSGNDGAAKDEVARLLSDGFGWKRANIIDLGDITSARGAEMVLPLWVRLFGVYQRPGFNFHIVLGPTVQG
jgi:8-hydroxy-5-deazaflavin:NADPH oxidoreductase